MSKSRIQEISLIEKSDWSDPVQVTFFLEKVASALGSEFQANRVCCRLSREGSKSKIVEWRFSSELSADNFSLLWLIDKLRDSDKVISNNLVDDFSWEDRKRNLKILDANRIIYTKKIKADFGELEVILLRSAHDSLWLTEQMDRLEQGLSDLLSDKPYNSIEYTLPPALKHSDGFELLESDNLLLVRSDLRFVIKEITPIAKSFFGIDASALVASSAIALHELIHLEDREEFKITLAKSSNAQKSFECEARVVNHLTGETFWLLFKATPVRDVENEICFWEFLAVDISKHKGELEKLQQQIKKIQALYSVTNSIKGYLDLVNISSRGLLSLCESTAAAAGVCVLSTSGEDAPRIVAHHGFSSSSQQVLKDEHDNQQVVAWSSEFQTITIISEFSNLPKIFNKLVANDNLRSILVAPIYSETNFYGSLVLFSKNFVEFSSDDLMLVNAASMQLGSAVRQSQLFSAYRKQTRNLTALYRLSHELTGSLSLDQIFQKSFSIIREELGIKRLWLGLLNEAGTRITGQAAYGPGWKKQLIEMNVEIEGREHPIAKVVASKKPLVLSDPTRILKEFGMKRFFSRFSIKSVGVVPLVSAGQVVGVLAFQPTFTRSINSSGGGINLEEVNLLYSIGAEVASVVLAKKFDVRISEAEKMQTAGLLAAGIAHNFNNLLQAILGQASLLEFQSNKSEPILKAVKVINEQTAKGANLVKQLMSFTHLEEARLESASVNAIIERGIGNLSKDLKSGQKLSLKLGSDLPKCFVDSMQVYKILQVLVANACDASSENGEIEISTAISQIDPVVLSQDISRGKYLRISVKDRGVGMDEDVKQRCFEPFFTTKNVDPSSGVSRTGAGLGLAAAYALAKKNKGKLVIDSIKGKGTTASLYLPLNTVTVNKSNNRGFMVSQPSELLKNIEVERVLADKKEKVTQVEKSASHFSKNRE